MGKALTKDEFIIRAKQIHEKSSLKTAALIIHKLLIIN